MIVLDVLTAAARAARMLGAPGRGLSSSEQTELLAMANAILDEWQTRRAYTFADAFTMFTLTPNHQPHLIGPGLASPDFNSIRPTKIQQDGIALVLNVGTSYPVDVPIKVRDGDWWQNQRVKTITTSVPTDVWYEAEVPNGMLWLWPIPTVAYGLRLRIPSYIRQFATPQDTWTAPGGFLRALTLTLAESVVDAYGLPIPPTLAIRASQARKVVQIPNLQGPRIGSADIGQSGSSSGGTRGGFNYYTGM